MREICARILTLGSRFRADLGKRAEISHLTKAYLLFRLRIPGLLPAQVLEMHHVFVDVEVLAGCAGQHFLLFPLESVSKGTGDEELSTPPTEGE